jgi:hypothetical protein
MLNVTKQFIQAINPVQTSQSVNKVGHGLPPASY